MSGGYRTVITALPLLLLFLTEGMENSVVVRAYQRRLDGRRSTFCPLGRSGPSRPVKQTNV